MSTTEKLDTCLLVPLLSRGTKVPRTQRVSLFATYPTVTPLFARRTTSVIVASFQMKSLQADVQSLLLIAPLVVGISCNSEHPQPNQGEDTDGIVTTGAEPTDGDDGVDDTGTGEADSPVFCIFGEGDGVLQGVKHQCNIEYDLDIEFTVDPPFGSSFSHVESATAVQTYSDESTYEHPMVAICCSDVTDHPE